MPLTSDGLYLLRSTPQDQAEVLVWFNNVLVEYALRDDMHRICCLQMSSSNEILHSLLQRTHLTLCILHNVLRGLGGISTIHMFVTRRTPNSCEDNTLCLSKRSADVFHYPNKDLGSRTKPASSAVQG